MDSDAVLLNITKLENGNVRNGLRGVDNPALDLTTVVADDKKRECCALFSKGYGVC